MHLPVRRALLSVSDKTGILDLARALSALDIELLSTGGTYKLIREAGIAVTEVSAHTGFPEIIKRHLQFGLPTIRIHSRIHHSGLA